MSAEDDPHLFGLNKFANLNLMTNDSKYFLLI